MSALTNEKTYTINDIMQFPEDVRIELADGQIYNMAPPSRIHQKLSGVLFNTIFSHISAEEKDCEIYAAPFGVFLDDLNYFEPDLSVICDRSRLSDRGCEGAPDWIIEIVSPSTQHMDYMIKLLKYRSAGVHLYWIVNPATKTVSVYDFQNSQTAQFSFSDYITVSLCESFTIRFDDLDLT
ncbi:MAG: Uma2 family endonuclease [Blautia sp.]|nr:Uma2 family endonuclease [Blautia sp.]